MAYNACLQRMSRVAPSTFFGEGSEGEYMNEKMKT